MKTAEQLPQETVGKMIKAVCERSLQASTEYTEHLRAAIITTADGFEVASVKGDGLHTAKVAAMVSTMRALGDAMSEEAGLNGCENVVLEALDGIVIMRAIPTNHHLVLCFVASKAATVGHLIWCSNQCAKDVSQRLAPLSK